MRDEPRMNVSLDEAIDAVLRDMMSKEAPAMLKARVLARLGDEAIDATLRGLTAREVPATLKARVMAHLDDEPAGTDRAREERWALVQPLLRPALGLAAAGLVAAAALTVWVLRTPWAPAPGSERPGQVASRLEGSGGNAAPGKGQHAQSGTAVIDRGSASGPSVASVGARRAPRSVTRPGATQSARHTAAWPGAESEVAAGVADDPLAIRQLRVEPLSVSTITIPLIEVTPVEIAPPMSDAPNPPGGPGAESRTGG